MTTPTPPDLLLCRIHYAREGVYGVLVDHDTLTNLPITRWTLEHPDKHIPTGTYPLALKRVGGWAKRIQKKFKVGVISLGSLQVLNVPGRSGILFHWGNTMQDTTGCILLGLGVKPGWGVSKSVLAYKDFVPYILASLKDGEDRSLTIMNHEDVVFDDDLT